MTKTENILRLDEEINRREVPALKVHPMVLGEGSGDLFAAGVADMDFKAPSVVIKAMQGRLDHGVFGYETVADDLLPTLTNWMYEQHGWVIDQSHILRAPNVLNALAMALCLFSNEGDGVIIQPPVFFDFFDIIRENKRKMISNPLVLEHGSYQMDFHDLEQKASDPCTKILLLCNPHNPVGRVWNKNELARLGDICARHAVLVVADEMHADLVFSGHEYTPFSSLGVQYAANSVICLSPAKTFNIAACCSAFTVITCAEKRAMFQAENSRLTVNKNNAFANVAMLAAYKYGRGWLDEVLDYIKANLDLAREHINHIDGVDLIEPEASFLLWLDFRALGLTPTDLNDFLRNKARWAVTNGASFGVEGKGFARVNIACTRVKLNTALDSLGQAISSLRKTTL